MLCHDCFSENNLAFYILPVGALMLKNITLGIKMVEQTALMTTMMKGHFFFLLRLPKKQHRHVQYKKSSNEWQEWIRTKLSLIWIFQEEQKSSLHCS